MADEILTCRDGAILELRFNRPDKKNAITRAMYAELASALGEAAADPAVRVVTLLANGDIFTSGNDLRDFLEVPPVDLDQPVFHFLTALAEFPKVLIAGVAGAAVGVGTTLLLHCDLVLATPSARFSLPFVDLGLVPEAASSLLLPMLIGRQAAAKHLILGDPFDAETAERYGLVAGLVDEDELEARVRDMAGRIAAKPAEAVRITKQLLRGDRGAVRARIEEEGRLFAERLQSPEAAMAFAAFLEKRGPKSSG